MLIFVYLRHLNKNYLKAKLPLSALPRKTKAETVLQ